MNARSPLTYSRSARRYPDLFLQMEGSKNNYFYDCDFIVNDLKTRWGLDLDMCKLILKRFMDIDRSSDGYISKDEFHAMFRLQTASEEYKKRLHGFFVEEGEQISLREFVMAVACVSNTASVSEKCGLAFVVFDKGCKGGLDLGDVIKTWTEGKTLGVVKDVIRVDAEKWAACDVDGDGLLNLEEFEAFVMAHNGDVMEAPISIVRETFGICFESVKAGGEIVLMDV